MICITILNIREPITTQTKEQLATIADFQGKWIKTDGRNDKIYIIEKSIAIINSEKIPISSQRAGYLPHSVTAEPRELDASRPGPKAPNQ